MSTTKKSGGVRYIRFNRESIQGKFIWMLSVAALIVGVLLAINFLIIEDKLSEQQQIIEVWVPTQDNLKKLDIYIKVGQLKNAEVMAAIRELNTLSEHWEQERMLISYEKFLEQLESLQRADGISGQELDKLQEFAAVQKSITSLNKQTTAQLEKLATRSEWFISYLKKLFLWEFIIYFIIGFGASSVIVMTVMGKIRKLKNQVMAITSGNLSERFTLKNDEFHTMSRSLNQLIDNLKDITNFAREVGRGNMDASINAFDEKSELGRSLSEMRDSLKKVANEDKNRRWINEGIAKFAQIVRLHNGNVDELSEAVTGDLVKYVGALQGALFITRKDNSGQPVLELSGCYAYDRQKYLNKQLPVNSGLIGQAYLEKAPKYLLEIPKNYDTITTGLGQGSPESILMMPLLHEGRVEGVLELASMHKFQEHELEFLNRITETFGAAVAAVRVNEETQKLLAESQGVTEELRSQEEEMRQNMEEMQATQEEMARAQKELSLKETNLNAFINNTSDSIITITRDYKVGLINDVLKSRYKGTQYEGLDAGHDIMPALGAVAAEWKAYYDRSFAGEYQLFTIKSSVKGEDSWREYRINPIRARGGEVVAVSVISRDTTEMVKSELKMKQKSAVLNKVLEQSADAYMALDEGFQIIAMSKGINQYLFSDNASPAAGDVFLEQLNSKNRSYWKDQLTKALEGEEIVLNSLVPDHKHIQIRLNPVQGDDKETIAILLSVQHS